MPVAATCEDVDRFIDPEERVKEVQENVKGLDFIMQLHPVTYFFKTKEFDESLRQGITRQSVKLPNGSEAPIIPVQKNSAMDAAYEAASHIRRSGFIAQEVEAAAKKAGYNFSGVITPNNDQKYYSLSYESFVVPLVKAVQEQQQLIEDQNKKIDLQQQQIDLLIKELQLLKKDQITLKN